jgi:hypothetical protein
MSNLEENVNSLIEQAINTGRPQVELSFNHEHRSECKCQFCEAPTETTFEPQTLHGSQIDYIAKIPTYTCTNSECGMVSIDLEDSIYFLQAAHEVALQNQESSELIEMLQTELDIALMQQEQYSGTSSEIN